MRSFTSLVGVMAVASFGCGSTVVVGSGEDGTGGGGEVGSTSTGVSDGGGPVAPPPNPPACPPGAPGVYDACDTANLSCRYLEAEGCTVAYTCESYEECWGSSSATTGGYGGYDGGGYGGYDGGGCEVYAYWQATDASCTTSTVECVEAQAGDVCALPGEACSEYGECGYEDKWCDQDHHWQVQSWDEDCCYDGCCYGECECNPYDCPASLPEPGAYCDPCFDAEYCGYQVQTECGILEAYASCRWDDYSWQVEVPSCEGTGGSGSGWPANSAAVGGGGWDGAGGAG